MGDALVALWAQGACGFGVYQSERHVGGAAAVVAGVGGDVAVCVSVCVCTWAVITRSPD